MNLCCTVNPYVRCACGMVFCKDCYGDTSIRDGAPSIGNGHITRIGDHWNGRGLCSTLNKVVVGGRRPDRGAWPLIVEEEVKNG